MHAAPQDSRPLSPHLGIYRWQITMAGSILHRMTGVALYAGAAVLVMWLWAAAYDAHFYQFLHGALGAWYGQAALVGWTLAFYYHLCNGIRHLVWDMGYGFTLPVARRTGWLVVISACALTALTWCIATLPEL